MKRKTSARTNSINHSPLRGAFILIALVLAFAWFALSPHARATCQEGCLTNNNTVLGDDALLNNTGEANTATGFQALFNNTTGAFNTANGWHALYSNTDGFNNTAMGLNALLSNTTGNDNTATGNSALLFNTNGIWNTATGSSALSDNTTGSENTANGIAALGFNTTGSFNTATGGFALGSNTTGTQNTATGDSALGRNNGNSNTATGANALLGNGAGFNNTATGVDALRSSTTGNYCTATGQGSLYSNTTGVNNTAHGQNALRKNTTGAFNIALGDNAGFSLTTGSNNIDIGNKGVAAESKTIRIGKVGTQTNTFIAGISGVTVAGGVGVIIDTNGHLGTVVSSERFKDSIQPMDKASEAILSLRPVTFRYKPELDPEGVPQFGLVAEEVKKVDPDLVARDERGKPYTVRYDAVNAMLLNEFLKEHREVGEQGDQMTDLKAIVAEQQKEIQALTASLKAQAAQIQKVSDQLELSRPAPRTVVDNH